MPHLRLWINEPAKAPEQLGPKLLLFTLESLRTDIVQCRDMQQKTLQWFSTAYSAIFLGGLVYLRPITPQTPQPDPAVLFFLFGAAEPVLCITATVVFLGELRRQGRAAKAQRGLESWAATQPEAVIKSDAGSFSPLMLENYMARATTSRGRPSYGVASYYLALLAVFGGALLLSSSFCILLLPRWGALGISLGSWQLTAAWSTSVVLLLIWATLTAYLARRIQRLAEESFDVRTT